jgi:hypothetical protein
MHHVRPVIRGRKRIQREVDEMRAIESTPLVPDFGRQYGVPYYRLYARFDVFHACSELVFGNPKY